MVDIYFNKSIVSFVQKELIDVKNLVKKYGGLTAVDGISFSVNKGEIFGLLGENGAGKTTTLEIIEGLRKPSSGEVKLFGLNSKNNPLAIKQRIGVQLQSSAYYADLTLIEILNLFSSFYTKSVNPMNLLRMVDLEDKKDSFIGKLSGGQRQRFSIIASLVNDPELVFLDEPTTGLDPLARRNLWDIVLKIKEQRKTIVLTTHYMEEAEVLCDRIAIMDQGKILIMGDTDKIVENVKNPLRIHLSTDGLSKKEQERLSKHGILKQEGRDNNYVLYLKKKSDLMQALKVVEKIDPESFTVEKASLEDLFLQLTGKSIKE